MAEKEYLMGNEAMGRGAIEAGAKVVAGYPGTPASEVLEYVSRYPDINAEWCINEKVALEICMGASLCNTRSLAVMKHNGTNVALDIMMHLNYTGVRGGLVLISGDDPGGISSQNEEDSRIITRLDAHLPVFDPWCPQEAKDMVKTAFELSEETELCFVVRPVMRVCHARSMVGMEEVKEAKEPLFEDDRSRFIMSAVKETKAGGILRSVVRHHWLNEKQPVLAKIMENSPFNHIEDGDGKIGLVACGIGYKEVGGVKTDELCIIVSVVKKVPLKYVNNLVPPVVDGVKTDVQETGVFKALQVRTDKWRPAPGGVSIGHPAITAGTLGCLVQRGGETFILSNNHVLAVSNLGRPGDPIIQPGAHDGGVEPDDHMRLDCTVRITRHRVFAFDHQIGLREALLHVSLAGLSPMGDVGVVVRVEPRNVGIVPQLRMDQFGIGFESFDWIEDRR